MKRFFHKDVLFSTLFVFLVMYILKLFIFNIHFLDPIANSLKDFEFTDIYYSRLKDKDKSALDTNIVIVNIAYNSREEIAKQIRALQQYQPKVIGIDATFEEARGTGPDSLLVAVLKNSDNIVLASYFGYDKEEGEDINKYVRSAEKFSSNAREGFVNFPSLESQSTIRTFTVMAGYKGQKHLSFPARIAEFYNPKAYKKLLERGNISETINYKGNKNTYLIFPANKVTPDFTPLQIVKNKIVLMGFTGPDDGSVVLEDNHFTPLNHKYSGRTYPDMYGVLIHANILSTILDKEYINKMPFWLSLLISFVFLYLNMYFFIKYFIHKHIWYHLFAKLVQLIISVILVGIELYLFAKYQYKIDMAIFLIPIILSIDVLYIYDELVKYLNKKFNYKTWFLKH